MYRAEGLTRVFPGGTRAVGGIDLKIGAGERVVFIGPSGAGKTTLFRMLNCTLKPTAGRLWIDGEEVAHLHGAVLRAARRKIGTIYQQHNLVPRLHVVHNVLAGRLGTWSTPKALLSLLRPAEVETAHRVLQQVGIPEKLYARTDELSGGQQQRVAIARVLLQDPDVILADEPVSSVDPMLAVGIVHLLTDISRATGKTLVVNLHSVDLALACFPRIIGLRDGRVLFDLAPEAVQDETLAALYRGAPEAEGPAQVTLDASFDSNSSCRPLPKV
jgi:phosphonate transport system ATP-binding protein